MIESFIITVLVIYGIKASTGTHMLLWPLKNWLAEIISGRKYNPMDCTACVPTTRENISYYLNKALFDCTPCMASVYGSVSYFIVVYPGQSVLVWPVWVFSISGFNYIINKSIK